MRKGFFAEKLMTPQTDSLFLGNYEFYFLQKIVYWVASSEHRSLNHWLHPPEG